MSIWNKVLLGLNILVSLGAFYFALQTLNVHETWRESAQKHEKRLEQANKEIDTLKQGTDGNGGIRALRMELFAELLGRGRVWYGCQPQAINNPETINVVISQPTPRDNTKPIPHNMEQSLVVYVFEYAEKNDGAANADNMAPGNMGMGMDQESPSLRPEIETTRFLGEFIVKSSGGAGVSLAPTMKLDAKATARLMASQGPWMMRELMPVDSHEIFAGKSEEELRSMLPEQVVEKYLNDGKEDFARNLRDYRTLLKWHDQRRMKQIETEEAGLRYNEHLDASLADAAQQNQFRKQLNAALQQELVAMSAERDVVLAYEASLKQEIKGRTERIDELMNKNRVLAQTIQEFQQEAISQINSRTASTR